MAPKRSNKPSGQSKISDMTNLNLGPVLLFKDKLYDQKLETVKLRHPKTNCLASFLHCKETFQIFELHKYEDQYRSWMIGDFILKDGSFHILTRINPSFLIIPYLMKNEGRFVALDGFSQDGGHNNEDDDEDNNEDHDDDDDSTSFSLTIDYFKKLDSICLSKVIDGNTFYKFDQQKTIEWLETKVERLEVVLKEENVNHLTSASVLPGLEASVDHKTAQESCKRYAWQMVCEYLNQQLSETLRTSLELPELVKTKHVDKFDEEPLKKKMKMEGPTEDYSVDSAVVDKKTGKLTAAQRKLSKVDRGGIKNISSFFTKPIKK